jgi:hypothetical protein
MAGPDTPGVQKLLQYWGVLLSSGAQRFTTASLWATVRSAANAAGNELSGVTIQDMNFLRAAANSLLRASSNLTNAADTDAIEASMLSRAPWSSVQAGADLIQRYGVRYEAQILTGEGMANRWMTDYYYDQLPATVGDLRTDLIGSAQQNAANGSPPTGGIVTGIGQMQIITGL